MANRKYFYVFKDGEVAGWKYCPQCGAELLEVYQGDYRGHTTCMTDDCEGTEFKITYEEAYE